MERSGVDARRWRWPVVVTAAMLVATILALRLEGRVWWCKCGRWWPWVTNVWTPHCSQHLTDPYSITHVSHGLLFYLALTAVARWVGLGWRFVIAVGIAAIWEVVENSSFIIERYRTATMSLDYLGDSVGNSLGDIGACALGFVLARWLGWWRTLIAFAASELVLLWLIRDNLTLNVIMLVHPIGAVRVWQSAGH